MTSPSLSGFKLTTPLPNAQEINPAVDTPPWLVTNPDGSEAFWGPSTGGHTPNSVNPRTELIALTGFLAGTSGPHTMSVTLSVQQVPASSGDCIIGQLHGNGANKSDAFVMVHYTNGDVHAKIKEVVQTAHAGASSYLTVPLLTGVPIGDEFSFSITDDGAGSLWLGAMHGTANVGTSTPLPSAWHGQDVRFQQGCYEQNTGTPGPTNDARLTVFARSITTALPGGTPSPVPVPAPVPTPVPTPVPVPDPTDPKKAKEIKALQAKIDKLLKEVDDRNKKIAGYQAQIKQLGG